MSNMLTMWRRTADVVRTWPRVAPGDIVTITAGTVAFYCSQDTVRRAFPVVLTLLAVAMTACSREHTGAQHSPNGHTGASAPMSMPAAEVQIPGYGQVRIDPERVQLMGVTGQTLELRQFTRTIRTVGIVEIDETRVAHVQTKFSGWIQDLYVDYIGKPVKIGQPLFTVYSPDLVLSQEEYLLSLRAMESSGADPSAAEADHWSRSLAAASRRRLELWDVPPGEIERLEKERTPRRTLTINSPRAGVVLSKIAVKGMHVEPGMDMFVIADLVRVWVQGEVYERDIPHISVGQKAALTLEALPGRTLHGVIAFISPVVDETTRTAKVRMEFNNESGLLKPGMYATVELTHDMGTGLALPEEALIDTGQRKIVFVALGEGRFQARDVQLGGKVDRFYQVLSGLSASDTVVTSAQFLLDSESRLKAGGGAMPGHGDMGQEKK